MIVDADSKRAKQTVPTENLSVAKIWKPVASLDMEIIMAQLESGLAAVGLSLDVTSTRDD